MRFRGLLVACCTALVACAHVAEKDGRGPLLPEGRALSTVVPSTARPAPRSSLLSDPALPFSIATEAVGSYRVTYLGHLGVVHGEIVEEKTDRGHLRHVTWVPRGPLGGADAAMVDVVALEHLYTMVLAGDAESEYRMGSIQGSASEALRELAKLRQVAIGKVAGRDLKHWGLVRLDPQPGGGHDRAAVLVRNDRGPLPGMRISFGRAPHSGCEAESDETGVASCDLVDLHGHEEHHDEDEAAVVATFGGRVTSDHVMPPTLALIRK